MVDSKKEQAIQQHILSFVIKQILLMAAFAIIIMLLDSLFEDKQESFHETSALLSCIEGLVEIVDCIYGLLVFVLFIIPIAVGASFGSSLLVNLLMTGVDNSQRNKSFWDTAVQALAPLGPFLFTMLVFGAALFSESVSAGTVLFALVVYLVPSFFLDRYFYFQYFNKIRVYKFQLDKEFAPERFQQILGVKKIIKKENHQWELNCVPNKDLRITLLNFGQSHNIRFLSLTGAIIEEPSDIDPKN